MDKKKLLVIDGNNLLHRAYHKFKSMKSRSGTKSSMAFGFPFILKSLIQQQKPSDVLVVFDGGRHKERLNVLPNYKDRDEDRDKRGFDKDDFVSQQKDVKKILTCLGIPFVSKKDYEADDIIWLYARKYKRVENGSVVIVSTDKDFNQLLSSKVSIWHPWKNKRITHKNVEEEYGYTSEQCVDYLSLVGDTSDKIPGAKGIGHKTAIKFINEYGSINNYRLGAGKEMNKFTRKQAEELFYRNRTLINIRLFCRRYLDINKIPLKSPKGNKIDKKGLATVCRKYSITTFVEPNFLKPFKQLL